MKHLYFFLITFLLLVNIKAQNKSILKPNTIRNQGNVSFGFWPLFAMFSLPQNDSSILKRAALGSRLSIGYFALNNLDTKFMYEFNFIIDNKFGPTNTQTISFTNQYTLFDKKISPYIGLAQKLMKLHYKSYPNFTFYNDPINRLNTHYTVILSEKIGASLIVKKKLLLYFGIEFLQPIAKERISLTPPFVIDLNLCYNKKFGKRK